MDNKRILYGIIGLLIAICIIAISGAISARGSSSANLNTEGNSANMKENTLIVTGLGRVSVKPDVAYLNVGVRTIDKDAKKAQDENKIIMEKVMAKLKSFKIDEKDIQTSAYNVWPRYSYRDNREILEGYEVENLIRITLRKIDLVGEVLDAVYEEGANRSNSISFGVLDTDAVYKEALEKAMDDAKSKAEVMAKRAEVSIQKPLSIYEGKAPSQPYRDEWIYADMAKMSIEGERAGGVPIASGELEIEAHVTIVYQVR